MDKIQRVRSDPVSGELFFKLLYFFIFFIFFLAGTRGGGFLGGR